MHRTALTLIDELCASALRSAGGGLYFFADRALERRMGPPMLEVLLRALQTNLLLLSEDETPGSSRDALEVPLAGFYGTHVFGDPQNWGWQAGAGVLRKVAPGALVTSGHHLVWDCESTLLLLGSFDATAAELQKRLGHRRPPGGLSILTSQVWLAFGSSTHSGDFLWRSDLGPGDA